jgi:hypothetical protein
VTLAEILADTAHLDEAQLAAAFEEPVLLLVAAAPRRSDDPLETTLMRTRRFDELAATSDDPLSAALERVRVFPVRKTAGADQNLVTLGRDPEEDIVLPTTTISRQHLTFSRAGEAWQICDAGSTNGTRVDGALLTPFVPRPLGTQARLQIGRDVSATFLSPRTFASFLTIRRALERRLAKRKPEGASPEAADAE